MLLERATNPTGPQPSTSHLDLILDDYVERAPRLRVFRSAVVHGVELDSGGRIIAVTARQLGSERNIRICARQVIDATGDAAVAAMAGARTRYGREGRAEHGESFAPLRADESGLGSTITMQARRLDHPVPFRAPDWAIDYRATQLAFDRTLPRIHGDLIAGFWWIEVSDPFHQVYDSEEIRRQLHRHVLGLWGYLKNYSDQREELANFHLEWIGQIPGKRESRRVVGDVTLTQHEVVQDARWSDEIGAAGWWIDLHVKGGIESLDAPAERENVDKFYRGMARVAPFSVPLRACYSADVPNLWMVGRCLSASHVALGPIRVQQTLAQIGQSVGTAAARAVTADQLPRELAASSDAVRSLQQRLLRDGVRLLNIPNCDGSDLALVARVHGTAAPLTLPSQVGDWTPVGHGLAQVIPELGTTEDRTLSLRLRSAGQKSGRVRVVVEPLTTIWDRQPVEGRALGEISVPPGADRWYEVLWPAPEIGVPVRIAIYPVPGSGEVQWAGAPGRAPTATVSESLIVCPGGPEPQNAGLAAFGPEEIEIPAYQLWKQRRRHAQLLCLDPPARPYEAANIVNGWAWPGRGANLWVSPAGLPAHVTLSWQQPVRICQVEIAFDTDLDTSTDVRPGLHRAPECVEAFRIEMRDDRSWHPVAEVTGNFQRKRVVAFEPRYGTALRVTVTATHGDLSARIYEIRAYGSVDR